MAGRGFPSDVEPIENDRIKMLVNGRWQKAFFPINRDRSFSGISLAESFADAYSREHNVDVGLIPCADGGTTLYQWREGGLLYDHAVYMARLAARTSTVAGVLWHQGESDCREDLYPLYEAKFTAIMRALRRDLDLYDVPFLCGGLGDYLKDCPRDWGLENYAQVNVAIKRCVEKDPMAGYVSAEGLTSNPDLLHFDARSLREFGLRYYERFKSLEDKTKVFYEKPDPDSAVRTAMEAL